MNASAQFLGRTEFNHAHTVPIFFAEQHHGTRRLCFFDGHVSMFLAWKIRQNALLDEPLDLPQLFFGDFLEMRKIKPQSIGLHQGSFLFHMGSQDLAQRFVQKVRCAVVPRTGQLRGPIDHGVEQIFDVAGNLVDHVNDQVVFLFGIQDAIGGAISSGDGAAVSNLTSTLRIERRLVKDGLNEGFLFGHNLAVPEHVDVCFDVVVTDEFRRASMFTDHLPIICCDFSSLARA